MSNFCAVVIEAAHDVGLCARLILEPEQIVRRDTKEDRSLYKTVKAWFTSSAFPIADSAIGGRKGHCKGLLA